MIIALDGPAGSGKSTIAKQLSQKLGVEYIDSGAIYRTLALYALNEFNGEVKGNEKAVASYFIRHPESMEVFWEKGSQKIRLMGEDVSEAIRSRTVTTQIKYIANDEECRDWVNKKIRSLANQYSFVIDGRDIGTVVFPDSKYKFYLDARPEIRAKRRALELNIALEGEPFEQLCNEIVQRDTEDKNRAIAPLKKADDATWIDTSLLSIEEVIEQLVASIRQAPASTGKSSL